MKDDRKLGWIVELVDNSHPLVVEQRVVAEALPLDAGISSLWVRETQVGEEEYKESKENE